MVDKSIEQFFTAQDSARKWSRTGRLVAIILAAGLAVGAVWIALGNRQQLDNGLAEGRQTRIEQDACAAKINAAWNAEFGQAAIAPVGSQERLQHAIAAAKILPDLENIDQKCYGAPATTAAPPTTGPPGTR